jgi:putative CocE/NonD family hydrolase
MQWLLLVAGKTSQEKMFWGNEAYWGARFRQWAASGRSFDQLDGFLGTPSPVFQEWISHPSQGAYWDQYNPSPDSYADMSLPVLTITGIYDADQHGALHHYRQHVASSGGTADHYLVIGPWDHAGTRSPKAMFAGQEFGPASLVDLPGLHLDWYRWTMQGGPVPAFLKNRVAYYVTGLEQWRYADRLEAITQRFDKLYLGSCGGTAFLSNPGFLETSPGSGSPDSYIYDPCDLPDADREADVTDLISLRPLFAVDNIRDVEYVTARNGRQLVYDGPVFECDTAIVGFFRLELWLAINRPDTDFRVCIYEIDPDQGSTLLAVDTIRARFRESSHLENIIETNQPLHYDFSNFSFSSRLIRKGSRLRLTVGPADSIFDQRNYNNAKPVANQNLHDASPVAVCLFHDVVHSSVLHVPLANIDG